MLGRGGEVIRLLPSASSSTTAIASTRGIANIPRWERHIRFDPAEGRKRPCQDVLDRFKRLNNGMWIRPVPGWHKQRYQKDEKWQTTSMYYETSTKDECEMLDRLMTPYWLKRRHYPDDPYKTYHVRHDLRSPRVDEKGNLLRERRKVLLEDSVADKYFHDR
ncbi:unnamed protein product, partial [Mesorhabditis belari]|uniref:Large ribosomal subunit protein bL35m n=1 Tax=Mesorhabditis belari TaxID=2138241 RepID=A0AAF3ESU6_9BILA